jgi:ABC-type lipoprotein release transport system permease subunit
MCGSPAITTVALGATRFLEELVYGVEPMDAAATSVAIVAVVVAALVATLVPARRLRRVHPADVLRSD